MSKPQATSSERPGVKAPKKKDVFRKVLPDGTDAAILFQFARGGKPISEKEFWDMVHLIHKHCGAVVLDTRLTRMTDVVVMPPSAGKGVQPAYQHLKTDEWSLDIDSIQKFHGKNCDDTGRWIPKLVTNSRVQVWPWARLMHEFANDGSEVPQYIGRLVPYPRPALNNTSAHSVPHVPHVMNVLQYGNNPLPYGMPQDTSSAGPTQLNFYDPSRDPRLNGESEQRRREGAEQAAKRPRVEYRPGAEARSSRGIISPRDRDFVLGGRGGRTAGLDEDDKATVMMQGVEEMDVKGE